MAIPAHIGQRDPGDGSYNPGLQTDIEPVIRDNQIYNEFISDITENTQKLHVDLFGRSPLTAMAGFWNKHPELTVTVEAPHVADAPIITHTYTDLPLDQAIALPVLGFLAQESEYTDNNFTITSSEGVVMSGGTSTKPLPGTDPQSNSENGFPEVQILKTAEQGSVGDDLYFVMLSERRANIAYDRKGNVRWFVRAGDVDEDPALWLPVFNTVRLSDGTFIGCDDHLQHYYTPSDLKENEPLGQRELWRFDATGRVIGIYFIRDRAHHSLIELPGENALLYASDYISTRNASDGPVNEANQGPSAEDCIAILDLETGYEKVYYDLRVIMNFWRLPVPIDLSVPHINDWIHLNQVYLDSDTNLLMGSCRHQSAVIGIDRATGALRFISGNHDDWQETESGAPTTDWSDLLLTPINPDTDQPYDLSNPDQKAAADQTFWTWGQHNIQEIVKSTSNQDVIEFSVFNNGNYRTRNKAAGVIASENASRCARYQVTLSSREVRKLEEYGETEVGSDGYSSYVSTASFFNHEGDPSLPRLFANFGGSIFQENGGGTDTGLPLTLMPGESDRQDPNEVVDGNYQGRTILQEVDLNTRSPLFDIRLTSGSFKSPEGETIRRAELYAFRAYKMPLYS
ncbi:aryl-sulfate sulfotransferase [Scandinavium sp. M-37]|uniref:aryl-sulfate sulfotransferase n=1 Tax=Scandinavium sp. M-37 TaxID=3373077 RepID=UPI0037452051